MIACSYLQQDSKLTENSTMGEQRGIRAFYLHHEGNALGKQTYLTWKNYLR
jgi:hypothetical protein